MPTIISIVFTVILVILFAVPVIEIGFVVITFLVGAAIAAVAGVVLAVLEFVEYIYTLSNGFFEKQYKQNPTHVWLGLGSAVLLAIIVLLAYLTKQTPG